MIMDIHPAGKTSVWSDALSQRNYRLAGGRWHLRTIDDASYVLNRDGLKPRPDRRRRTAVPENGKRCRVDDGHGLDEAIAQRPRISQEELNRLRSFRDKYGVAAQRCG